MTVAQRTTVYEPRPGRDVVRHEANDRWTACGRLLTDAWTSDVPSPARAGRRAVEIGIWSCGECYGSIRTR